MAENEDGQERSEDPTGKRLGDAREKGQVPRSRELATLATLMTAAVVFLLLGDKLIGSLLAMMRNGLTLSRSQVFDTSTLGPVFVESIFHTVMDWLPFFLLLLVVGVLASGALGGWVFSTQALELKLDKFNIVEGVKRLFSVRGLLELLKSLAKFLIVMGIGVAYLSLHEGELLGLGREPLMQGLSHLGDIAIWSFLVLSASLVVLVGVDVPFQIWQHQRQLKMTKQEVKEEHKQQEGSPEVKGRIRRMQMEAAQRRMMESVPEADVVVTNPTHYAVALRYDQQNDDAPVVVAMGKELIAARIRSVAAEHDVPILSAPPLARALYHNAELEQPIPVGLYRAVAQVLAYVYHLRQGPVYSRGGTVELDDLPIPDDLRRDD